MGRLPGRAARDAKRARNLGRGRHVPRADLARLHVGREGRLLRRLPATEELDLVVALLQQVLGLQGLSTPTTRAATATPTAAATSGYDPRIYGARSRVDRDRQRGWRRWQRGRRRHPATVRRYRRRALARRAGRRRWPRSALLMLVYVALAVPFAADGSRVVLATAGGSPGWLLGPFRGLGAGFADGSAAGPLFYLGLWLALLAYVAVLALARSIGARLALGAIAAAAPPLPARAAAALAGRLQLPRLRSPRRPAPPQSVYAQPRRGATGCGLRLRGLEDARPAPTARSSRS